MHLANFRLVSIPVPFRLSWGKLGYSRHVFITLADNNGKRGKGEGVLYKTTHLDLLPALEKNQPIDEPGLAFALDTAARDIKGEIFPANFKKYSIIREIFIADDIESKVADFLAKGTRTVKLKVGAGVEEDKKAMVAINKFSKGRLQINLDANQGYSFKEAVALAKWAKRNNVVLFEEPIHGDFRQLKKFKEETGFPVMLDESIKKLDGLEKAITANCFDILNIKLSRLGGITQAEKYLKRCQKAGIKIYLGCSEELEIGTNAIFTFARSIKDLYGIEGLGTERIDPKQGFSYEPGKNNRQLFLLKEFLGLWKTRLENVILKLT